MVYADILLIVSDINDPEVPEHIKVTEAVIEDLGASGKPVIYVYNKCDILEGEALLPENDNTVVVSGKTGMGIEKLLSLIEDTIHKFSKKYTLIIPYSEQSKLSFLYDNYTVNSVDYLDTGISVEVILDERGYGMYERYAVSE